jgi:hypothetical protein
MKQNSIVMKIGGSPDIEISYDPESGTVTVSGARRVFVDATLRPPSRGGRLGCVDCRVAIERDLAGNVSAALHLDLPECLGALGTHPGVKAIHMGDQGIIVHASSGECRPGDAFHAKMTIEDPLLAVPKEPVHVLVSAVA